MLIPSIFLSIALSIAIAGNQEKTGPNGTVRVLFIGNSLTESNNLPAIVEALAASRKDQRLVFKAVVFGGFSLEDHWHQKEGRKAISVGGWDFVVLQQGP